VEVAGTTLTGGAAARRRGGGGGDGMDRWQRRAIGVRLERGGPVYGPEGGDAVSVCGEEYRLSGYVRGGGGFFVPTPLWASRGPHVC
jgi:hypothetical protein